MKNPNKQDTYYDSFKIGEVVKLTHLMGSPFGFNQPIYGKITEQTEHYCFNITGPLGEFENVHMSDVSKIENNELFDAYTDLGKRHLKIKEKMQELIEEE